MELAVLYKSSYSYYLASTMVSIVLRNRDGHAASAADGAQQQQQQGQQLLQAPAQAAAVRPVPGLRPGTATATAADADASAASLTLSPSRRANRNVEDANGSAGLTGTAAASGSGPKTNASTVTLVFVQQGENGGSSRLRMAVGLHDAFDRIAADYAIRCGRRLGTFTLLRDGERPGTTATPASLDIGGSDDEEECRIDVMTEQVGG